MDRQAQAVSLLDHPSLLGYEPLYRHLDMLAKQRGNDAYPPFDILLQGDTTFIIRIAVAGFTNDDLRVIAQPHQILVIGKRGDQDDLPEADVFHSGIAFRAFQRRFALGPGLKVLSAEVADGILEIVLQRPDPGDRGEEIPVRSKGA